jgi:enoyl-CoA hydratase/carnithine racemase
MATYISPTELLSTSLAEGVLTLALNRPDALNAFRPEMLEAIALLITQANDDDDVSVVVLAGVGRAFSAGVDLKVLQGTEPKGGKVGDVFDAPAQRAYRAIRGARMPVIAKVHGACFTGALEIALHCDLIYTTANTKFGDTHAKFGLRPTWGMSQTLAQAVGIRRAKELSFTARLFLGSEALELGMVCAAAADKTELDDLVAQRAAEIVANSPSAIAAIKDLYDISQRGLAVGEALAAELANDYPEITDTSQRLAGF